MTEMRFCPKCGTERLIGAAFCQSCGLTYGAATGLAGAPVMQPAPAAAAGLNWGGALLLAGGALAILGSFLPWILATAALVGTVSRSGMEGGDGIISVVVGLFAVLMGVARLSGSGGDGAGRLGGFLAGAALIAIGGVDYSDVAARVAKGSADGGAIASVGVGLYSIILGGVLAVVGSLMGARSGKAEPVTWPQGYAPPASAPRARPSRRTVVLAAVLAAIAVAALVAVNVRLPWTPPDGFATAPGSSVVAFRRVDPSEVKCTYDSHPCAAFDVATSGGCPNGLDVTVDVMTPGRVVIGASTKSLRSVAADSSPRMLFDLMEDGAGIADVSAASCR